VNWHQYFFKMVDLVASKSKDRSTCVGAVIVGPDNEVRTVGFNGFPRGVDDNVDSRHARPQKYLWTEHAERNAIFNAARIGTPLKGCRIYLRWWPCSACARAIIQAGIVQVLVAADTFEANSKAWSERWKEECEVAVEMLREAGVETTIQAN